MSEKVKQLRQGDVVLEGVASVPDGAKAVKPENGRYILAHGEATGHCHSITADAEDVEFFEHPEGGRYVKANKKVKLTHDEHTQVAIEPGVYKVIHPQVEYTPQEIVSVRD